MLSTGTESPLRVASLKDPDAEKLPYKSPLFEHPLNWIIIQV